MRAYAPLSQLREPCNWLLGFHSMSNGYLSWEAHVSKLFGLRQALDRRSKRERLLQRTRDTEDESGYLYASSLVLYSIWGMKVESK